ncbi:hypothetical protein [Rhizobium mayense]|uniref:Secreted protein n=1 Tax=Rhizobium mayense TaxID=1312184 RepID=A0ABT7K6K3_9HYPH|nr:hypothetical protein [Rhizobium mayense]MDL2403028.1 hypothetical protein [Rhizobium mayense]
MRKSAMKPMFVMALASTITGTASAQSQPELYLDRSKVDVTVCAPENPNCECNPKKNACWFKLPEKQWLYFERSSMKIISKAQYEAR